MHDKGNLYLACPWILFSVCDTLDFGHALRNIACPPFIYFEEPLLNSADINSSTTEEDMIRNT
jgi:hypothetical protein